MSQLSNLLHCGPSFVNLMYRGQPTGFEVFPRESHSICSCGFGVFLGGGEVRIPCCHLEPEFPYNSGKSISRLSNLPIYFPETDLPKHAPVLTKSPFLTLLKVSRDLTPRLQCQNCQGTKKKGESNFFHDHSK